MNAPAQKRPSKGWAAHQAEVVALIRLNRLSYEYASRDLFELVRIAGSYGISEEDAKASTVETIHRLFPGGVGSALAPDPPKEQRNHAPGRATEHGWPLLGSAALHGLAGDVVRTLDPHTEADPIAVLFHFLVMFGNAVGPTPHVRVGADFHRANIFAVIVGATSKGRKGTSEGQARRILGEADPVWAKDRIVHGLSSGEGLVSTVRDPDEEDDEEEDPQGGKPKTRTPLDRRLLVIETEFASTLRVMRRDGNSLSGVIRQSFDSGNLGIITRKDPVRATGAHISILAHTTRAELLRYMDSTETDNGFANRFHWLLARRSKSLPDGGHLTDADLKPLQNRVASALDAGRRHPEIRRDSEAGELWRDRYEALSSEKPGLFGAVTSRAEAQALRLSLIYALLDMSPVITADHLEAALALWEYSAASARRIFGELLGDPVADHILQELRLNADGLSRTEISTVFGRNLGAAQLQRALVTLKIGGLARAETKSAGKGRPAERWFAVDDAGAAASKPEP